MSRYRRRVSRKGSKRLFTVTQRKMHKRNLAPLSMRGGIRL